MNLSGSPVDYVFAFFGGVLVSFSPCVYPLLPVSTSYIGINAVNSKLKGFTLSLTYVTGIAVTYAILGLIASLTGSIFGRISSHYITYMVVGGVMLIFSFSMFDLFHLSLFDKIRLPKHNHKKHDYLSTFILGLISGLVVGPCVTTVLGAILAYLATKRNLFYGATLLFVFAYGMGLIFILIGTFSGFLLNLPKPGRWLKYLRRLSAVIVLIMGLYFIREGIRRI